MGVGAWLSSVTGADHSARQNFNYSMQLQKQNQDWQTEMANTAHQREVQDLKEAGLNPVLSAGGSGAETGTPGGGSVSGTPAGNPLDMILNTIGTVTNSAKTSEETKTIKEQRNILKEQKEQIQTNIKEIKQNIENLKAQEELLRKQGKTEEAKKISIELENEYNKYTNENRTLLEIGHILGQIIGGIGGVMIGTSAVRATKPTNAYQRNNIGF